MAVGNPQIIIGKMMAAIEKSLILRVVRIPVVGGPATEIPRRVT